MSSPLKEMRIVTGGKDYHPIPTMNPLLFAPTGLFSILCAVKGIFADYVKYFE